MQTEMAIQNPGASMPLVFGLDVICNTPDDEILANVLTNSRRPNRWVKREEAHDRVCVICGSGPSLADHLEEIVEWEKTGIAEIWALNNAANYLASEIDLTADCQVIMDAQPHTLDIVGPAITHLFASQVDPALFDAMPNALLWHSTHGNVRVDEQDVFPQRDEDYCLIGSAVSVGNTALVLAYAMGYRTIHVYGMDSSHRDGAGHVMYQSINDGDPCTIVEFNGKEYVCSLTMRLQADSFMERAAALTREGCKIEVHGTGLLPDRWNAQLSEEQKYVEMWKRPEYRETSPGERVAKSFIEIVKPLPNSTIGDFGCGTGRGALAISKLIDCDLTLIDFAENSCDKAARIFKFVKADLTKPIPASVQHGFCSDVMEHIPPENVDAALINILAACEDCFFQISTVPDHFGSMIGHPLHLTVQPHAWWREKLISLGCSISWEYEAEIAAFFHVSKAK